MKLNLQVYNKDNVVMKSIAEVEFPDNHMWAYTGLKISDLSIYDKNTELVFSITEDETRPTPNN